MTKYHDPIKPSDEWLQDFKENHWYNPITGIFTNKSTSSQVGSDSSGYVILKYKGIRRYAHHMAWYLYYGQWPESTIDHKNRRRSDNRINNLQTTNMSGQARNRDARSHNLEYMNISPYGKGIYFRKGRYEVYINRKPKREYLGVYYTLGEAQEAVKAYHDRAKRKD